MDEYVLKQKIQKAFREPEAPERLIRKLVIRAQAVTMGTKAQKQLETASAEQVGHLASQAVIGQLAAVSELPKGAQPEQLAQQLEQEAAFREALRGGNVAGRLSSGQLLQRIIAQETENQQIQNTTVRQENLADEADAQLSQAQNASKGISV